MKIAETVTFGGSGLDRAAQLRGDDAALASVAAEQGSVAMLIWRGKPLVAHGSDGPRLARLAMDHPVLAETGDRVFLGQDDDGLLWMYDLSDWAPEGVDEGAMNSFMDHSEQRHPALPDHMGFAELRGVMTGLDARDAELAASARAVLNWHRSHLFCSSCGQRSQMAMSGWQRNCAACGAQHFPRTDPVVIMCITHGNSVLMGRSPGWPRGMYSLLAGFVEPGETIEAAVRREVFEEAGITVGQVTYLASQPWAFPNSLMFGCWGVATSRDITIDPKEIEDAIWVTREDMLAAFAGQHPFILPARKGAIAHFILRNWLADRLD
ncbi:MAG: NAD(+) diphosphatase [Paracoccaceae bacterium]